MNFSELAPPEPLGIETSRSKWRGQQATCPAVVKKDSLIVSFGREIPTPPNPITCIKWHWTAKSRQLSGLGSTTTTSYVLSSARLFSQSSSLHMEQVSLSVSLSACGD
ncbi:hypothetical protein BsWGS_25397 [Bradybaena similaris]